MCLRGLDSIGGLAVGCMHTLFSFLLFFTLYTFFRDLAPTTLFGIFSLISAQGQSRKYELGTCFGI